MMTLLMLLILGMLVGKVASAALGVGAQSHHHRRQRARMRERALPEEEMPSLPAPAPETPLEKLQRAFARGDMSIEQYERELNRLYRIRG